VDGGGFGIVRRGKRRSGLVGVLLKGLYWESGGGVRF